MLKWIKQHAYPVVTYAVSVRSDMVAGHLGLELGDIVKIQDNNFVGGLILKARITEQIISFSNPNNNNFVFSNIQKLKNAISSSLQERMARLAEEAQPYEIELSTDRGWQFKNGQGESIVSPTLRKGKKQIIADVSYRFYFGTEVIAGQSYKVVAAKLSDTQVLTVAAYIKNTEVARTQLTFVNINDGRNGRDGAKGDKGETGADGRTPYFHRAWANSADGRDGFSTSDSTNKRYLGTLTDFTEADSQDPTRYKWTALSDNVSGGNRNYFKDSRTKQINTGGTGTYDFRTFIVDDFWVNPDRLKPNYVRISFEISLSPALTKDTQASVHFSATPWYSNKITLKAGVTAPQKFEFIINLSGANENYKTDNVFVRFGTNHGFPANLAITLDNAMLSIGTNFLGYVKAIEDVESDINSKADQVLTQEQLNALNEKAGIIQAELEAKASAATLDNWLKAYQDYVKANDSARAQAEKDLVSATQRVSTIAKDLGELSDRWNFIDTYMSSSNDGLVIGKNDGSSSMMFNPNGRISMYSAGVEVMYISRGVIHIENGIFSKTIQIGRFREEQYHLNADMNVIRYVGGA